ncbi:MAG: zinc ribbon domain-containing protein [Nitrospirae bacterium]|nr:zinc ribbon domain-containing protein [Nitrospirota bacterium]
MPMYEFSCNNCKADFELLMRGSMKPVCPECKATDVRKKLSVFGMSGISKQTSSGSNCGSCHKSSCSSC